MSFVLNIAAERWRSHTQSVNSSITAVTGSPGVPVSKGNGYGLGQALLAQESELLAGEVIAVGTVFELEEVLTHSLSDVVVLEPFDPRDAAAATAWWSTVQRWDSRRVIRTVSSMAGLEALLEGHGSVRIILEGRTSMHRFGFSESEFMRLMGDDVVRAALASGRLVVLGLALHLPIEEPAGQTKVNEVLRWNGLWQAERSATGLPIDSTLWLSHLSDGELAEVTRQVTAHVRLRVGTRLWLGDRGALTAHGSVLAVHPLSDGVHVGYRQRSGPSGGTLVIVAGGTSHGIGLAAPSPAASLRQRVVTAGTGALDAAGRALSPFSWQGKQRWFAETPHQHHSMVWLPRGIVVPQVGDTFTAEVRFTTSRFDSVLGLGS